ncbi:hypothetical protein NMU03_12470 [Allocoprobacillus halotolerans]|uniref:HMA domain-containing protein n=1 Tax=Allocoprobacillus halotolerans TaxID=2944914 RepID=A0ABY5I3C1_9FIRM|nr:hypothetical protein [Allocoprobacillus halotolerans]UTY38460.1 hypothetical protein NMU03_12470 [Allocoprobacillus halotolerans]
MKKKFDVIGMTCSAHVDKAVRGLDGVLIRKLTYIMIGISGLLNLI